MRVEPFRPGEDDAAWDELVRNSLNGTFLHSRRYLGYHGDRFVDLSRQMFSAKGALVGVFPAAEGPEGVVVSHPGITYGGIVQGGEIRGEAMIEALRTLAAEYASAGFRTLRYKAVPVIYQRTPVQDDLYALFRLRGERVRCDLSATMLPDQAIPPASLRTRRLKKARAQGLTVRQAPVTEFWPVLEESLRSRYGATPVHSIEEIAHLSTLFPDEISCWGVFQADEMLAGVVLYHAGPVDHAQYIASTSRGYDASALDVLFAELIERSTSRGRLFDFGTSNEQQGWVLNESLYWFKRSFGAGGVAYETYEIDLTRADL
jgi:hypothetical protein